MIKRGGSEMNQVTLDRLLNVLEGVSGTRVVVAGDAILDRYIWGKVSRISPEAPVPVVNVTHESVRMGGACNVVHNVQQLGGKASLVAVVGADIEGDLLLGELFREGVDVTGVVRYDGRPTTTKTRVVAHSQQLLRFDHEEKGILPQETQRTLLEKLDVLLQEGGVLLLSDYAKGVLSPAFVSEAFVLAKKHGVAVFVDPKVASIDRFHGATILTPNNLEASQASGVEIVDEASLMEAGQQLISRLGSDSLLITRGEAGMTLFEAGNPIHVSHIPAVAQDVYDVTGAGDTVIATMSLSFASGATLLESAVLANMAAGAVVGIVGTAAISKEELKTVLSSSPFFDPLSGRFRPEGFRARVRL
ncbi:MAG: D-glycero-beta-D-manno-heptose-7-phosphate kinase [Leptospirales bacterium]